MNPEKRQLLPLTGMRCFLALWVVVYHQLPSGEGLAVDWFPAAPAAVACLLRTGYIAVSVFFVLSGFVLSYNYDLRRAWSGAEVWRFAAARFARIYPAYFLGFLLTLGFMAYRMLKAPQIAGAEALNGVLNVLLLQAWVPQSALTWNFPGWSLSNESFFYCMFPFAGVLLWRLSGGRRLAAGLSALWLLSVAAPLWSVLVNGFDAPATAHTFDPSLELLGNFVKYNPLLRIPEFFAGILLGKVYQELRSGGEIWFGRGYRLYAPGIAAAVAVLAYADRIPLPLVNSGLLLPVYGAIILGLALDGGILARMLSTRPLVFLGNASYSMYILHAPLAVYLIIFCRYGFSAAPSGLGWVAAYTAVVVVVSSAVYRFIEEPANRRLKRVLVKRRIANAPLAAVSAGGQA